MFDPENEFRMTVFVLTGVFSFESSIDSRSKMECVMPVVQHVLEVDDLSTRLDGKLIVDSVSLSVEYGEVVGVVGANGSGKTTLLRTLAGLLKAESG